LKPGHTQKRVKQETTGREITESSCPKETPKRRQDKSKAGYEAKQNKESGQITKGSGNGNIQRKIGNKRNKAQAVKQPPHFPGEGSLTYVVLSKK